MNKAAKRIVSTLLFGRLVWSGPKEGGLYLTFDDGPHGENTEEILRTLKKEQCVASFFLSGDAAFKHQSIVRDIHAAGHLVANHGMTHQRRDNHNTISYVRDAFSCQRLLERITGDKALKKIFRPPYGELKIIDAMILIAFGYRVIMWSIDSEDSFISQDQKLLAKFDKMTLKGGDILLFHEDSAMTTRLLPKILSLLKRNNDAFSSF